MRLTLSTLAVLAAAACGGNATPTAETTLPDNLAALGLFDDAVAQLPAAGVEAYDVNAVLFADESEKLRFLSLPDGERAGYDPMGVWDFPDGTIFVKTFYFPRDARDPSLGRRLLETRIIERTDGEWTGRTYLWNDAQTEATRLKVGKTLPVTWIDAEGTTREQRYRVPNDNECKTCHSHEHRFEPLGPRTRQLNRERNYNDGSQNQIDRLQAQGLLDGDAEPAAERFTLADPYGDDTLERRARGYLDANCSHCHRPGGEAGSTALDLRMETREPYSLGVCRTPVAAGPGSGGRRFDIVPGDPDASILLFRMESTDPALKMPELPTLMSDARGSALVRDWIASMEADGCD